MAIVTTRYGQMRTIDADSIVSKSLELYGEWANEELAVIETLVDEGDTLLDIGAFIGTHTLAFSKFVGVQGAVISFEPRIETYSVLIDNVNRNFIRNVTCVNKGLSDRPSTAIVSQIDICSSNNFGALSLASNLIDETRTDELTITTIDSCNFSRVNLLKVDVEGMELAVLRGGEETIQRFRPLIFCECNDVNSGIEVCRFARSNGYKVYGHLSNAFCPLNFNGASENIFGNAKEASLLLLPEGKSAEALKRLSIFTLVPILTADDLVVLMLGKPQYPGEVLDKSAAAAGIVKLYSVAGHPEVTQSPAIAVLTSGLAKAESLAMERLRLIQDTEKQIETIRAEYRYVESLALGRLMEIKKLNEAALELHIALEETKGLAIGRFNQIVELNTALEETKFLAVGRLTRIEELVSTGESLEANLSDIKSDYQRLYAKCKRFQDSRVGRVLSKFGIFKAIT
jgi:FkbM family methyltransferase